MPGKQTTRQGDRLIAAITHKPTTVASMVAMGISRYPVKRIKECLPADRVLRMELDGHGEILYWVEPKTSDREASFLDSVNDIAQRIAELVRQGLA